MAQKKDALGKGLGAIFSDLLDNDTGKKTTAKSAELRSYVRTSTSPARILTTKIRRN